MLRPVIDDLVHPTSEVARVIGAVAQGDLSKSMALEVDGRPLDLTKTEFDLLELLLVNANIVVTRDTIYERIWGYDFETSSNSLDVYIGYLRRKTEGGGEPRLIQTARGVGYVLREGS